MESPPPNEWFKQIENIQPAKEHKEHKEQYNHSVIEKHTSWMVYLAKPQKKMTFSDEIRRVHSYFRPFAKKLNMRVVTIPFQSQSQALAIVCGTTMQLRRKMLFIFFKYKHCKGLRKTKKLAVQRTEGSTAGFFRLRWQICNGPYQNQAPEAPRRQTSNSRILCFLVEGSVYRDRDT
jgi:hypothetical protein